METPDTPPAPNIPQMAGCQQEPCSASWVLFSDKHPKVGQLITVEWKAPYDGEVDCEWAGPESIDWNHEVIPERWRPLSLPNVDVDLPPNGKPDFKKDAPGG
jgi:hypothetical protein